MEDKIVAIIYLILGVILFFVDISAFIESNILDKSGGGINNNTLRDIVIMLISTIFIPFSSAIFFFISYFIGANFFSKKFVITFFSIIVIVFCFSIIPHFFEFLNFASNRNKLDLLKKYLVFFTLLVIILRSTLILLKQTKIQD